MQKATFITALSAKAATAVSSYIDCRQFNQICVAVVYVSDGSGDGNLTFYGSPNGDATSPSTYKLGVAPTLTGTIDADGVIGMGTTSQNVLYTIEGVNPWVYFDWAETVDGATISVYVIGLEI